MDRAARFLAENWLFLLFLAALAAAFILFRTSPTELADESAFDAAVTSGRPAVVEFYSNY